MTATAFGDLFQFIRNGMSVKQDKSGDGLPISRIETISDGSVNPHRVGFAGLSADAAEGWFLEVGDILFSHINSVEHVGKCAVYRGLPDRLVHGMNLLNLRCDQSKISPEFAKYLIRSPGFRNRLASFINKAVNQASVSIGNLTTIPVNVPSLREQRRIAAILDQADALRAKRRETLAQLDSLTQSIFIEMFGDPSGPIANGTGFELADVVAPGRIVTYGIVQAGPDIADGVPYIKTSDIKNGLILEQQLARTTPEIASAYTRSALKSGDIVMSIRATVGTTALVPPSLEGANLTQGTARISPGAQVQKRYLLSFLQTEAVQSWIQAQVKGATFREITLGRLRQLPVLVPPMDEQKTFATRIQAVEALKATHHAALTETDELFASLQHRAFTGAL